MDKIVKLYIIPLSILLVGSFLIRLTQSFLTASIFNFLNYLLVVLMLVCFGYSLNSSKKRLNYFKFRHIIIILLTIFLYLYELNILNLKIFDLFRKYVVYDNFLIKVLYIYFGWLFAEK